MRGLPVKTIVTKHEDLEVEIDEEQIEYLMCALLKEDYETQKELLDKEFPELVDAIKVVYQAYSGKPIDYVERFSH